MCQQSLAAMAEWLRRLTRNQMGSSRVGSNPTRSGTIFDEKWESSISSLVMCQKISDIIQSFVTFHLNMKSKKSRKGSSLRVGFEPTREDPI